MRAQINANLPDIEFSYVCDEDIEKMIYELLTKFDMSGNGINYIVNLKIEVELFVTINYLEKNKRVLKEKFKITKNNDINCCAELENRIYIILDNSNTIKFVFNLIHEFSHYINFAYVNYEKTSRV